MEDFLGCNTVGFGTYILGALIFRKEEWNIP
jgi:hypothetical protein